jgi:ubiquinone/menaquinone biosynthesis C-methylase UbiE
MTQPLGSNRDLRDEIRDYWSDRAATFDAEPGHKIGQGEEQAAWQALVQKHLGSATGRRLLDLASGTGEIARLCHDLGYAVTGLDWSEPMLERARAKVPAAVFMQADAERTMLPDASFDVIVTRHLVWTLVDPAAAFAEWKRVLVPGGQLLLVDGDFVTRSWVARTLARLSPRRSQNMNSRHQEILSQIHFAQGARAEQVAFLLAEAGFTDIRIDTDLSKIHRAQARQLGWRRSLIRHSEHRYAISAKV